MNTKLKFAFEKETKGAVRYQEVGEDGGPAFAPQVGTLYIRKSAMPGGKSENLIVRSQASKLDKRGPVRRDLRSSWESCGARRGAQRLAGYMARVGRL